MAALNFDARTVQPDQKPDPVPGGWYNLAVVASEQKPSGKNPNDSYIAMTVKILDGQYAGRQVFDNVNLYNSNPVASEIAWKRMSAYCHATGVIQMTDTQQLHGIPFKGRLSVKTDSTGQYDPSNELKALKHINEDGGNTQPGNPAVHGMVQQAQQGFPPPAFAPQQQPQFAPAPQQQQFQAPPQQMPSFQPAQQAPAQMPQFAPAPQQQQMPTQQQFQQQPPVQQQFTQQQVPPVQQGAPVQPGGSAPADLPPWMRQQ